MNYLTRLARAAVTGAVSLLLGTSVFAVTQIHKCVVDGAVTYQSVACSSGPPRQVPTVEQLNNERKKRAAAVGEIRGAQTTPALAAQSASSPNAVPALPSAPTQVRPSSAQARHKQPSKPMNGSGCDGRRHCSQMTSCAEAKYFLANCPGVQMDGNRDGIPCEQQWCSR